MNKLLGGRIRELRNAANLTQEKIAEKIGMSRQKYARIENGTNSVNLDVLSKIAVVLGISVLDVTRVLDEVPAVEYRVGGEASSKRIFDMLDLFYANKHMYDKLRRDEDM